MSRSRLEPLGVSRSSYEHDSSRVSSRGAPGALDRWLLSQLKKRLGEVPLKLELWDRPRAEGSSSEIQVRFTDRGALLQLLANPALHFGDLYSTGRIEVTGDLLTVLKHAYEYLDRNAAKGGWLSRARSLSAPDILQSKRNIHHHYDIGNAFYELWLDREALQYTCAYYADERMSIEQAQQAKMHHVCRKLWLKPGERVVEAGSGWGGFALFMAKNYGANVRSFNISTEQVAYARDWAKREGLDRQVEFVEDDYRNIAGEYDVFVSIGMLEHVGVGNYAGLGRLIGRSLRSAGRGLIHTIGRDRPGRLNPWIDKRIFPGACPPTLRQMMDIFEPSALSVLDVENLRLHYARTLEAWLERYEQHVGTVRSMFDEAFVHGSLQLFQVLFARSTVNEIPWTRARIYE
jgi:cyclopropane-fatty-acyl-phospholipid synthase